jgi:hypothetical protein
MPDTMTGFTIPADSFLLHGAILKAANGHDLKIRYLFFHSSETGIMFDNPPSYGDACCFLDDIDADLDEPELSTYLDRGETVRTLRGQRRDTTERQTVILWISPEDEA